MIETSNETAKLDAALAKAQGEIEAASKDKINPAFRSKYADLTAVWAAIRPALSKYGISVTQWPIHSEDDRLHMVTRLACSGEWIRGHFSIPVTKKDAHGYGSATTYAKRFSLAACIGVVADEDDDGNGASNKSDTEAPKPAKYEKSAIVRSAYEALELGLNRIADVGTMDDLSTFWLDNQKTIKALPADWLEEITAKKDDIKATFKDKAA